MTIRSAALRLVATGGAVLAVEGCIGVPGSAHAREPQTITIEVSDSDFQNQRFVTRAATVSVGDTLTVILASNGSTGFGWTADARIGDTTVMQQTSQCVLSTRRTAVQSHATQVELGISSGGGP